MRQRITFIHGANDEFVPSQLQLENDTLHIDSLKAAREDRLNIGLYELPQELWRALKQCHELHIRWVSLKSYPSIAPFISRANPGLHVFFTPQRNRSADLICPLLIKTFGTEIKCVSPGETFTWLKSKSERSASSVELQYHAIVPSLESLVTYLQLKICPQFDKACQAKALGLSSVDYLDIDYDAISKSLVVTIFWHESPSPDAWTASIPNIGGFGKTEVGIFGGAKAVEPEEISFSGFLTTIGESTRLDPTRFSFPSRHHPSPRKSGITYLTSFPVPRGLHPTLRLTFPSSHMSPPHPSCALYTYLILPSPLFVDKYQLSSPLFLASQNLHYLRSVNGETDLEAPDWTVSKWGSTLLIELAPSAAPYLAENGPWHASIPLHLRYLAPTLNGSSPISIPWPIVFWGCPADKGTKMSTNPFDRVNLGYEGLFSPQTTFYHLQPGPSAETNGELVHILQVPVIKRGWEGTVESGTVTCVLFGALWVVWKLFRGREEGMGKRKKEE